MEWGMDGFVNISKLIKRVKGYMVKRLFVPVFGLQHIDNFANALHRMTFNVNITGILDNTTVHKLEENMVLK